MPDIGDIGDRGARAEGTFLISPAWQASETFLLEDLPDGDGTEWVALMGQVAADVVDREVLLSQGGDPIAEGIGLGSSLGPLGRGEEEVASRILAELMDQDAEASWGIAEAVGSLITGQSLDELGAERFVLAMGGVGWFEEDAGEIS